LHISLSERIRASGRIASAFLAILATRALAAFAWLMLSISAAPSLVIAHDTYFLLCKPAKVKRESAIKRDMQNTAIA
jgi:hypothetical protein